MLPIKLNSIPYNFPTELHEVTLGQFFALRRAKDVLDEICALTGLERQTIQNFNSRADLAACQVLLSGLGKKLAKGIPAKKLPKQTTIAGKVVNVPANLKLEPVGAFIAVHNLIAEEQRLSAESSQPSDPLYLIPQVLANYFWRPYMGADMLYSDESIDDETYIDAIFTIPITDAIPIANFFFRKYPHW